MTPGVGQFQAHHISSVIQLDLERCHLKHYVLLPDPEGPSKSTFSLSLISIFKLSKILRSPLGYFRRKFFAFNTLISLIGCRSLFEMQGGIISLHLFDLML